VNVTAEIPAAAPADDPNLAELAYARTLDSMLAGVLKPGAVMHERRLADHFGISRTPIREALGRLEVEQLLTRRTGRTLVVSEISLESYINLLDMRRILEVELAARATGGLSPATLADVETAIQAIREAENVTPTDHWAVDDLVHGTIADAAGNPMIAATIRDLRRRTHIFNTARITHRRRPGAEEHLALIRAVAGQDADLSRCLMGQHLDNVRDAIIDYILVKRR
jgi:DNA-binding GntR family transcriptional regulator